ncbi:hypothetical protein PCL_12369 [Purpureocillium lilacinum]|uniref:Uncharacterized protein n=1 Tax=Purpureocillium lilacinum TaxID=33203 RepID=A0A2U3E912_PURLI|nr:hypothetical protein PCL_12369 [Purpureocillium lilacinum]
MHHPGSALLRAADAAPGHDCPPPSDNCPPPTSSNEQRQPLIGAARQNRQRRSSSQRTVARLSDRRLLVMIDAPAKLISDRRGANSACWDLAVRRLLVVTMMVRSSSTLGEGPNWWSHAPCRSRQLVMRTGGAHRDRRLTTLCSRLYPANEDCPDSRATNRHACKAGGPCGGGQTTRVEVRRKMSSTPHEPRKLLKPTDGPDVPQPALSRPEPRPGTPARSRKSQATAACESREAVARFGWRASAGVVVGPVSNVARQQSMAERGAESSAAIDISPSATRRGARCHDTEHGARRTDGQPTSWPSNAREDPPWIVFQTRAIRVCARRGGVTVHGRPGSPSWATQYLRCYRAGTATLRGFPKSPPPEPRRPAPSWPDPISRSSREAIDTSRD